MQLYSSLYDHVIVILVVLCSEVILLRSVPDLLKVSCDHVMTQHVQVL